MAEVMKIREIAGVLNLQNVAKGYIDLSDERLSNLDYIQRVFEKEIELRSQNKIKNLTKQSKLPKKEFDYSKVNQGIAWHIEKLKTLEFIEDSQNVIILGKCGSGKTSFVSELGDLAVKSKYKVYYTLIDDFIEIISKRETILKRQKQFQYMKECDLIIVDDVL